MFSLRSVFPPAFLSPASRRLKVLILPMFVVMGCNVLQAQPELRQSSRVGDVHVPFIDSLALPTTGTLTAAEIGDGVWYLPELDETSITRTLTNLNLWGIENIYVDVFRSGETLLPSTVFPQRQDAVGRDWLGYIITQAHARNIRVHAWVQVLRWRDGNRDIDSTHPLLAAHPDWLELTSDGVPFDGDSLARYVSPGVPEVQNALAKLTREICAYPIDGINLDSIQYDEHAETGYNPVMTEGFQTETGVDVDTLEQSTSDSSDWMKWVGFREDKVTSVVQLINDEVRRAEEAAGRRILLSATVQPVYEETRGRNRSYQHWGGWLKGNLVGATIPQCFNPDLPGLEKQLWQSRSVHMGSNIPCIPGLLLDETTTNSHPTLKEQQRLLENTGFQSNNIMDYRGLLLEKTTPAKSLPKVKRGFWSFLKSGHHLAE